MGLLLVLHVVVAILMVGLILIQQGKGAEAGASMGAGASSTVFGASGSGNFLTKSTAVLATIFFVTSIFLGISAKRASQAEDNYSLGIAPAKQKPANVVPAVPASDAIKTAPVPSNIPANPVN